MQSSASDADLGLFLPMLTKYSFGVNEVVSVYADIEQLTLAVFHIFFGTGGFGSAGVSVGATDEGVAVGGHSVGSSMAMVGDGSVGVAACCRDTLAVCVGTDVAV